MLKYYLQGFTRFRLCFALAIAELKQFFHRAILGVMWVTLSFFLFIFVKTFIFSSFINVPENEYVMWVSIGYALWVFISTSTIEGSMVFVRNRTWMLSQKISPSVFVMQSLIKLCVFLVFNLLACLVIGLIYKYPLKPQSIFAIFGFIILFINHILWQTTLGYFAARYRDIIHFIQAIMRMLFFLTPILFMPAQIGSKARFLDYNPFTHFLAIIREPIMYGTMPIKSWIIIGCLSMASLLVTLIVVRFKVKNLTLWI